MTQSDNKTDHNQGPLAKQQTIPGMSDFAQLIAARNQAMISFYFDRLHQYELFYKKAWEDYAALWSKTYQSSNAIERREREAIERAEMERENLTGNYEASLLQAQADAAKILELAKAQAERIIEGAHRRADQSEATAKQTNGRGSKRSAA